MQEQDTIKKEVVDNEVITDHIKNLDEFVQESIFKNIYEFIIHYVGKRYCPICEKPINSSDYDDLEDLDVHLHNEHQEFEVLDVFKKFLRFYQNQTHFY